MATNISMMLPESIAREMPAWFSLEELLVLERVDASWRNAIASSGAWNTITLRHEQDANKISSVLNQVAIRHGNVVTRLEIVNCAIVDSVLLHIGSKFSSLTTLIVSGCKALSSAGLAPLLTASHHTLEELRAVRCPLLCDKALTLVNEYHRETLRKVDVSHCRFLTPAGVTALVQNAQQLHSLGLKGCPKINDSAVVAVTQHCPQLRSLSLGGSGAVTDVSLRALGDHCVMLETLDIARSNPFGLSRGGGVTDDGVTHLLTQCTQIQQLVLRGQGALSPASLALLPTHCPQLTSLDIGGCRGIVQNQVVLCALLQKIARLEHLSVSFCGGIVDDHQVSSIASQCPALKKFDVDGETISTAPVVSV